MKTSYSVLLAAALGLLATGCNDTKSTRRFQLPAGNADQGRTAFLTLKCIECHTVAGVDLPKPTAKPELLVHLGGEVTRLRSYGDLLTSIVHPSRTISEKMKRLPGTTPSVSPMPEVNDIMTVAQLIDLVTFLQPKYTQLQPIYEGHFLP